MSSKKYVTFRDEAENENGSNSSDNNSIGRPDDRTSNAKVSQSPQNEMAAGSFAAATSPTAPPSSPNSSSTGSGSNESSKNSIFALTRKKKQKPMPKIQSSGVVNYGGIGIGENSDSESESVASTISNNSNAHGGYALPFHMQSGYPSPNIADKVDDDELSQRTPIPKAPPNPAINAILPSHFLRNRTNSDTNLSDLSEDDSVIKRQKREQENVGRLVHTAKQQHSFAQAWFSAGQAQNALPPIPPKKKLPSNAPPGLKTAIMDKASGPIDLDSGEVWDAKNKNKDSSSDIDDIENHSKLNLEIGSFTYGTTHSAPTKKRANKRMIQFGVPDDEDLTTYYIENKCLDRIVCTIADTKCTFLALIVVGIFVLLIVGGGITGGIVIAQRNRLAPSPEPSASPTLSQQPSISIIPTMAPTTIPTMTPSLPPTSRPSLVPSLLPTLQPSETPTGKPSSRPSSPPSPMPSSNPTDYPTSKPSSQPSLSPQPSSAPSDHPSTCFSSITYEPKGQKLEIESSISVSDRFGHSVSLSQDGNILAVGALLYPENRGSVRVYERTNKGAIWTLKGEVIENEEGFGTSLKLSDDGLTLIVGRSELNEDDIIRVYSFDSGLDRWIQLGSDIIETGSVVAGFTVSISGNGLIIAIGDHGYDSFTGRVGVYEFNGTDWIIRGGFIEGSVLDGEFGHSVSLSQNGNIVACGGPREGIDMFSNAGAVRIFQWNQATNRWDALGSGIASFDFFEAKFGFSVSISDNGTFPRVVIGAPFAFADYVNSGSVTVWEYDGLFWNQVGPDIVGKPAPNQKFGLSVSIAGDGTHVAVGNPVGDPFTANGEVQVYFYNGDIWDETEPLRGTFESGFGHAVDLSRDGTTLAVGASSQFSQGYTQIFDSNDDCESL